MLPSFNFSPTQKTLTVSVQDKDNNKDNPSALLFISVALCLIYFLIFGYRCLLRPGSPLGGTTTATVSFPLHLHSPKQATVIGKLEIADSCINEDIVSPHESNSKWMSD